MRLIAYLIPLIIAVVCILFIQDWSTAAADGLLGNLAMGCIGTLITIFGVDTLVEAHKRSTWKRVRSLLDYDFLNYVSSVLSKLHILCLHRSMPLAVELRFPENRQRLI